MNRSKQVHSIVLSLQPLGENNSSVTLLTPERGIIRAVLYGGPKSRLKSLVAQWNSGTAYLYENTEKNQVKITDFEVKNYHYSFRESLLKLYAASLAAELAIKTSCAGSSGECFRLVSGLLDGMELSDEEGARLGLVRFLWRYLQLLGVQPDPLECGVCSKKISARGFAQPEECYYNVSENIFVCKECLLESEKFLPLSGEGAEYLGAVSAMAPSQSRRLCIRGETYLQIRQIVFFLIKKNVDQRLNSIETGMGIL